MNQGTSYLQKNMPIGPLYTIGLPFQYYDPYNFISVGSTNITHNSLDFGSAIIVGGPQGVLLEQGTSPSGITVEEGAYLDIHIDEGCAVNPFDYKFISSEYRSAIINNTTTDTSILQMQNNELLPQGDALPPYVMLDEFKNNGDFSISNRPNPFTSNTTVNFFVKEKANVTISLTDVYGKILQLIINNVNYEKGNYSFELNTSTFATGIYYCQMKANETIKNIKLIKTK